MTESTFSQFPQPVCKTYFEKAIYFYRKVNDLDGALHCQYKVAEFLVDNCIYWKTILKITKGRKKEEVVRELRRNQINTSYEQYIESFPKDEEKEIELSLKLINDCIDNYTEGKNMNVQLNMKHVKVRVFKFMGRTEESYKLINEVILKCLQIFGFKHLMSMEYLKTKSKILVEKGPRYYGMAIKCLKLIARWCLSQGSLSGSENTKVRMKEIQKLFKESGIKKSELIKKDILPFRTCSNVPYCQNREVKLRQFKWCSQCRGCVYCSKKCQAKHWKLGHKNDCKKWKKKIDNRIVEKSKKKKEKKIDDSMSRADENLEEIEKEENKSWNNK